ncbi:MAG: TonB-dependent receptor [Pseudomonadota bacterium]
MDLFNIRTVLLLSVAVCPAAGFAQSPANTDEPVEIDELVVSAARTGQPATSIAGTVSVIDRETLRQQAEISDDLASVLSAIIPGFAPSSQKLAGRGETLRGRNPLYLIDGVPQHNALRDGQRDGHSLDLDFVERIEVINGSNAIQGVGATGGVVNTVTRSPVADNTWRTTTRARFTTADDFDSDAFGYKLSVLTGRGSEDFDFIAGVALHERGLFIDSNGDAVGLYPTQGDIMDSTSLNLYGKAEWRVTDNSALTLMINDFDLERNGDFRAVPGDRDAGIPTGTVAGDPSADVGSPARNEVTTVSLSYRQQNILGGTLEAQVFDQSFSALFEGGTFGGFFRLTPDGDPFLDQSAVVSDKNGVKITFNREFSEPSVNLSGGLDFFRDESAQELARSGREWVPETSFETISPFLQLGWDISDAVTLSGGVRHEDASLEVDDYTTIASANSTFVSGGEPDFTETLFNVGLIWRITGDWSVYAASSEGFTMPDVGRVLRAVSTPDQDVDSLLAVEPIVTDNLEFGIEFDNGSLSGRLTYYESTADNGARLFSNPEGIFEVQRQRTEIDGFEAAVDYTFNERLSVGGNYSRTNGEFDSDGDDSVDSDLDGLNIGPDRLNLYAYGLLQDSLRWRVQVSNLEDRNFGGVAAPVGRDFDGYTKVDLFGGWMTELGEFSIAIDNVLNEEYFTYFAQTEPAARADTFFAGNGRTITLGWQKQF